MMNHRCKSTKKLSPSVPPARRRCTYYSPDQDISFVPLTHEEEKQLFEKFYAGDTSSRDELIARHLKLTAKLSIRFAKGGLPEDEAISAGNLGLIQALECRCFDPNRGVRFGSYVRAYIRGQIIQAIREKCQNLQDFHGVSYGQDAVLTGHKSRTVARRSFPSIEEGGESIELAHKKFSEETGGLVDHGYEEQQLNEERLAAIEKALATLPETEANTIRQLFLRDNNGPEAGKALGLSRQGIWKAKHRAMAKLKQLLATISPELS